MIPRRPAPDLIRGGNRFPACAKPGYARNWRVDASAGEGRSDRIMRKNYFLRVRPNDMTHCLPNSATIAPP